ncbi:Monocarboxylate transporter 9 [Melipona quadrifasciata]|uniref:Monocarboxylate transporter 9 n=1 Tax=Melipona quadrifasciata TaxID=166423 RepID=A0A0N0U7L4_9HYME|nr:Monocarboxylate transporter 9 [Melipona quadrifasciata]
MSKSETTKLPPDGSWGWMIVLAYSLNGICTISIMQGFGLIFKDTFPRLGFNATEGTIILNTNLAFGMILGLVNGPFLRIFGYRKMALIGSTLFSGGVITTTFAKSFTSLMISYGIFASLGSSMTLSAFSYALNSYFTKKRGRAMSLAMTLIGVGPIIVPQVTTFLISYYGFQGTILLYGAFTLHGYIGSSLLHPLKWYTKNAKSETMNDESFKIENEDKMIINNFFREYKQENKIFNNDEESLNSVLDLTTTQRRRQTTISSIDHDAEIGSIYGLDISYARQISETLNVSLGEKDVDKYTIIENGQMKKERLRAQQYNRRFKSTDTINLGSSIKIFEEKLLTKCSSINEFEVNNHQITMENNTLLAQSNGNTVSNANIDNYFDLDLLRDPIYVNIMLGMSVAIFAEINFSQLTPFFLMDMKMSTNQIATVMSTIASVAPFIGEWLHQPPRIMYLLSLCLLIISRTSLLFVNGFMSLIIVAIGLGASKGIRSIYMSLVIPCYVPIHKLPNASGLQMIVNGTMLLSAGPMLGIMRDNLGSFTPCIIVINCITALTVAMWTVEILIIRKKKLQKQKEQQEAS